MIPVGGTPRLVGAMFTWPMALALLMAVSACSGLRGAAREPQPNPQPAIVESAPPPAESPPEPPTDATTPANAAAAAPAAAPNCVPPEAQTKSKPKVKARPKSARRDSGSQPSASPALAETPADGVVDAQVRPMPVSVMSILGKRVQSPHGDDLGRVVDVLADSDGRVRVAIIDFGGFLGVGDHRIAVDWPLLRFNPDTRDPSLLLSLSREKLKAAPEYKDNPKPQTLMEPPTTAAPDPAAGGAAAPAENKK